MMTGALEALDLREVGTADVYLDGDLVASLSRLPRDVIQFSYNAFSLERGGSVRDRSVSWSLPVDTDGVVMTTGGAVPAFLPVSSQRESDWGL
jgi:serine/threonine-protein kinase HipA